MIDLRPLLFINALAVMLLITAGFATIQRDRDLTGAIAPGPLATSAEMPAVKTVPVPTPSVSDDTMAAPNSPFETPVQAATTALDEAPAKAIFADEVVGTPVPLPKEEPVADVAALVPPATTVEEPVQDVVMKTPELPSHGRLVIRSNVDRDTVSINGKLYGSTRLEVDLPPGNYVVEVSKAGFSGWRSEVVLGRGEERNLRALLEEYTSVEYRNGVWRNNVVSGDGSYVGADGLQYTGSFVNKNFQGRGTAKFPDGSSYQGAWFEGKMSGNGTLTLANGDSYTGEFKEGKFQGSGTYTAANGDSRSGQWAKGELNGEASLSTAKGLLYVGGFLDGKYHGQGTLTYPDSQHYEGTFSQGQYQGNGTLIYADGKKYVGQFMDGKYHGKGELYSPNGGKMDATFKEGAPYGQVTLTTPEGEVFTARTTEPGVCYRLKSYRATQCPTLEVW